MSDAIEHIFREHYGLLVAALVRRVGAQHIAAIEDAVQYATMQALETWLHTGTPGNPSGWLYKVAYRQLLSGFRTESRRETLLAEQLPFVPEVSPDINVPLKDEMSDALLQMLFVTCDEKIPAETQLVFTLKVLCGFFVHEIAARLFTSQENVYKRFARAKHFFEKNS